MKKKIADIIDMLSDLSNTERHMIVDIILVTTGKTRKLRSHIQDLLQSGVDSEIPNIPEGMSKEDFHAQFDCLEINKEIESIYHREHLCGKCVYNNLCKGHAAIKDIDLLPTVTRCMGFTKRE